MTDGQTIYKAAVIGLGFVGAGDQVSGDAIGQKVANLAGTHAQALSAHPQVQLLTGSSRDEGRRKRFEERMGVSRTYADWHKMLAVEDLDIASIATNSPYHAEITTACAEAGVRAVYCEKPIATRLADADRAIGACREHGTMLVVNHQRRWDPLWLGARDEICGGAIGQVSHAVAHWSAGRLGNAGTHFFDALRMLLAADAQAVSGTLDPEPYEDCRGKQFNDPGGWGTIAFTNGVRAFINAPQKPSIPLVVRVVGTLGQVTLLGTEAKSRLWNGRERTIPHTPDRPGSMLRAVDDIVKSLMSGEPPSVSTGEDGMAAMEMVIGFHVSSKLNGQWVPLPITGADRDLEVLIG